MSLPRIHLPGPLPAFATVALPDSAFRHLVQVLRLGPGDAVIVFDGQGLESEATLLDISRRSATLQLGEPRRIDRESPLQMTLVQGIAKGERMDWTLQKAVELGVATIVPVITERCNVRLDGERWDKKLAHWAGVIVAACEQCGRNTLPQLHGVLQLDQHLNRPRDVELALMLSPGAQRSLRPLRAARSVALLVGPEGGLSPAEERASEAHGFQAVTLGPRTLRTETAAIATLAALGALWGDLG